MRSPRRRRRSASPFEIPTAPTVLLILDMISNFDFPDGPAVLRAARRIAPRIVALKERAAAAKIPVIYVNDNLGRWRSDVVSILKQCLAASAPGRDVVRTLAPTPDDLVVLKPRHSGFYATPLAAMLEQACAKRVILTGASSHQCVLFTANDAYLREFEIVVPSDCVASPTVAQTRFALKYFKSVLSADVRPSARLRL